MVGIVTTAEALRMAREAQLDLVEVAPTAKPPVCRIMDYGKWRYQQQKKEDKGRSHSKGGQLKELKIKTVKIGDNDLQIKINHARDFLEENNKVQFVLQFRGRELAHIDLGYNIFRKIKTELADVCKIERDAKMEGKRMTLVLQPGKTILPVPGAPAMRSPGAPPPRSPGAPPPRQPFTSGQALNIGAPAMARPPLQAAPAPTQQPAGQAVKS